MHLVECSIWSESELKAAFPDAIEAQSVNARILCIVDGLDECEESSVREAVQFLLGL